MKRSTYNRLLLFVVGLFMVAGNLAIDRWPTTLYYGDSNGYYLHVVSFFVNQDVGDYDKSITTLLDINPNSGDPREDKFGIRLTEKGRRYIKYTLGVPVMEVPFFLLGHAYATLSPKYEANGWSKPYMLSVGFAIICYVLLGLHLLMGVLGRYFSQRVVMLTVLALVLATNLFYHTTYVTMSHGFLFFQHCLLIWLTVKFYDRPGWGRALAIGAAVGLIALTRVPEVVSVLVPLVWGVSSVGKLRERVQFLGRHWYYLFLAGLGLVSVFSLQMGYWYYVSDHFFFNPYQGEGFNFARPRFLKAFFDFKNGWLIYTPIMAFAVWGLFLLPRYAKGILIAVLSFVVLTAWIHYSYYVYSYFPGLGQRPMVETYPLLSFGLASAFTFLLTKKSWKWVPVTVLVLFGALNLFQTWQSKIGVIWSERHNAAFYWATFGALEPNLNSLRSYDTRSLQPEETDIALVQELFTEGFEDSTQLYRPAMNNAYQAAGEFSYYSDQPLYTLVEALPLTDAYRNHYLKVSIQAYMHEKDQVYNRDLCATLILEIFDEQGKRKRDHGIAVSTHIGNQKGDIWTAGLPSQWGTASFYTRIPRSVETGWTAKVYVRNSPAQKLYLDELKVELYGEK